MRRLALCVLALGLVGCGDDGSATGGNGGMAGSAGSSGTGGTPVLYPLLDCDPITPDFCGYPFPSNVYTIPDDNTPTGLAVRFGDSFMRGDSAEPWDLSDGFSAGSPVLAYLPGMTDTGLSGPDNIPGSLEADSPTVVVNAATGERAPHFAITDALAGDEQRGIIIRPTERLEDGTRYIVALRGLVDSGDTPLEPSPVFAALRDNTELASEPSVEARRTLYEEIFTILDDAGITRADLQLAWDFTTASDQNNTQWMLHMRDEALASVGSDGPQYTITSIEDNWNTDNIAYRIFGTFTAPLYVTEDGPGALLNFGDDGMPEVNASQSTAEIPFEVLIPNSALSAPASLLQYGHGLFGRRSQVESPHFRSFINTYNYIFFGVDLQGMAGDDVDEVREILTAGDFSGVRTMFDRLHQGFLNSLLVMRMMKGRFSDDLTNNATAMGLPEGVMIDPSKSYYYGISQGGIMGSVYLALSTDVERGALGVMGQPYSLLLFRSVDFAPFFFLIRVHRLDAREHQLVVAQFQMLWDRVEPSGYSHHVTANPLPGTNTKEVLMRAAIADHQVTTLGAHIMARTMGAMHLESGIRPIWNLPTANSTPSGSFYIEYDFGLPGEPLCNVPMNLCEDPHEHVRRTDAARMQLDEFLRNGTGTNHCPDGVCSYPAQSGCEMGETPADVEALCMPAPADG